MFDKFKSAVGGGGGGSGGGIKGMINEARKLIEEAKTKLKSLRRDLKVLQWAARIMEKIPKKFVPGKLGRIRDRVSNLKKSIKFVISLIEKLKSV